MRSDHLQADEMMKQRRTMLRHPVKVDYGHGYGCQTRACYGPKDGAKDGAKTQDSPKADPLGQTAEKADKEAGDTEDKK